MTVDAGLASLNVEHRRPAVELGEKLVQVAQMQKVRNSLDPLLGQRAYGGISCKKMLQIIGAKRRPVGTEPLRSRPLPIAIAAEIEPAIMGRIIKRGGDIVDEPAIVTILEIDHPHRGAA